MTKYCDDCKQTLTFAERWGVRKHVCNQEILDALAYKAQEEHKLYLERKRVKQEMYKRSYTPSSVRSSSGSSRRVSASYDDDTLPYVTAGLTDSSYYSSSYSSDSSSSYSSSSDSSSSSSDSGSCSSGD